MPVNLKTPEPIGSKRHKEMEERREKALKTSCARPVPSESSKKKSNNGEESKYSDTYCMNFSKGLSHNDYGIVGNNSDYEDFVDAINRDSDDDGNGGSLFEQVPHHAGPYHCQISTAGGLTNAKWRAWESPRAGHVYDLQGPDADALLMPPAPTLDSDELAFEMAEVYLASLVRDVHFKDISSGLGKTEEINLPDAIDALNNMAWRANGAPADAAESNRWYARTADTVTIDGKITGQNLFRGSSPGCQAGPYISQFLLVGNDDRRGKNRPEDGYIVYGSQQVDQRHEVHLSHNSAVNNDYMTNWASWLDVQNGANFKDADKYESKKRFITTPRDLATYVHFDQLYQAYLNAALIMGGGPFKVGFSRGFPSGINKTGQTEQKRGSFATFGGPHLLALLTEVSSRALKAVRREKFNFHRRCRPERIGGLLTLASSDKSAELGNAEANTKKCRDGIPEVIRKGIRWRNKGVNDADIAAAGNDKLNIRWPEGAFGGKDFPFNLEQVEGIDDNLLLPMAFPEGSPMHPAYGAGHATVAGACVTVLKAFYELYKVDDGLRLTAENVWDNAHWATLIEYPLELLEASDDGDRLVRSGNQDSVSILGELNKLAANIAIGRNFAGVHYYTDYYDSLRLGERVAVGILQEQLLTYPEPCLMRLQGFNGERIVISHTGSKSARPKVEVRKADGDTVTEADWWAWDQTLAQQLLVAAAATQTNVA